MILKYVYEKVGLIARLAIAISTLILAGSIVVFYLQTEYDIRTGNEHLNNSLQQNAALVMPILINSTIKKDFSTLNSILQTKVKTHEYIYKVEWIFSNGISLIATSDITESHIPPILVDLFHSDHNDEKHFSALSSGFNGELITHISHAPLYNEIWDNFLFLTRSILAVTLFVALAIILFLRSNLRMINSLGEISNEIRLGNFSARISPNGPPEFKKAAFAFNAMTSHIENILSELDEHKRELTTQLHYSRQLLEAMPNPVCSMDMQGRLISANHAWNQMFNLNQNKIQNKDALSLYSQDEEFSRIMNQSDKNITLSKQAQTFSTSYQFSEDTTKQLMISKAAYFDASNEVSGFITCLVDLTELENALDEKSKAEAASHTKSRFLANMSHEMRTPLTAIIGLSESLLNKELGEASYDKTFSTIARAGKHLSQLINDLLDVSKIEAGKLEVENLPVELVDLASEVIDYTKFAAEEKSLNLSVNYCFPLPEKLLSDPLRLKQILINLVNNAVKFTSSGSVTLEIKFNHTLNEISFVVIDTGIGISTDQANRLFSPFSQADVSTTRKFGGTGLGLYLSKILTEKLGGSLTLDSEQGVGSRFSVTLPFDTSFSPTFIESLPDVKDATHANNIEQPRLVGKILLVEDNPDNQEFIKYILEQYGVTVSLASDGEEAVNIANQRKHDLILMDVQMPKLDGLEATRLIRQMGLKTTIIALTANASSEDKKLCLDAGYNDFLVKPIDRPVFYQTIAKYLQIDTKETAEITPIIDTPITSSLAKENTKLFKIVTQFVHGLPNTIDQIEHALKENNQTELTARVHSLKGLGGNIGFHILTDISANMETHMKAGRDEELYTDIKALRAACERIKQGLNENTGDNNEEN